MKPNIPLGDDAFIYWRGVIEVLGNFGIQKQNEDGYDYFRPYFIITHNNQGIMEEFQKCFGGSFSEIHYKNKSSSYQVRLSRIGFPLLFEVIVPYLSEKKELAELVNSLPTIPRGWIPDSQRKEIYEQQKALYERYKELTS